MAPWSQGGWKRPGMTRRRECVCLVIERERERERERECVTDILLKANNRSGLNRLPTLIEPATTNTSMNRVSGVFYSV